jgi:hypothetical protein
MFANRMEQLSKIKDWEEIVLSDRGFQPFVQSVGGGVTGSGGLHEGVCCFTIKDATYFEEAMSFADIHDRYVYDVKPLFDITECNSPCADDLYRVI